jgi:hypothetical protein
MLFALKSRLVADARHRAAAVSRATGFSWVLERLRYLALAGAAFAIHDGMRVARIMRASVIDTLSQGYIITARAKGLTRGQIIRRHVLRNSQPAAGDHRRLCLRFRTRRRGAAGDRLHLARPGPAAGRFDPHFATT